MNQITSEGKYCGDCPCKQVSHVGFGILVTCDHFDQQELALDIKTPGKFFFALRLPECLKQKPQIIPTAKFNHEACAALWEQIGNDFMGEGREKK